MSSFTEKLYLEPVGSNEWRLVSSFTYYVRDKNSNEKITVPAGFVTDFASVPRIFWNILPPWGQYGKAAIIHDYLYYTKEYPKKKADRIFLEAMKVLNVPLATRTIMYSAVVLFGKARNTGV